MKHHVSNVFTIKNCSVLIIWFLPFPASLICENIFYDTLCVSLLLTYCGWKSYLKFIAVNKFVNGTKKVSTFRLCNKEFIFRNETINFSLCSFLLTQFYTVKLDWFLPCLQDDSIVSAIPSILFNFQMDLPRILNRSRRLKVILTRSTRVCNSLDLVHSRAIWMIRTREIRIF